MEQNEDILSDFEESEKKVEKTGKIGYNGGVSFEPRRGWRADTYFGKSKQFLGWFESKEEAEAALDEAEGR